VDYGGNFMNTTFQEHLVKQKIHHNLTAPYTLKKNGVITTLALGS
jgi:hypothetical protein